jgi:phosphoribosyl 1,2-cyclic phosphodiesterase
VKQSLAPEFDVWGCRGSHNIVPAHSRVGNGTSCYSLLVGEELYVLDAGRGLLVLGHTMPEDRRFAAVKRVHILVTHAHLDHWEGLKDVDWFWRRANGLHVTLWGTAQALRAIQRGFAHPSYVPLEVLARGTVASLKLKVLKTRERRRVGPLILETFPLHHYSGGNGARKRTLDTAGYRLSGVGGPRLAYLSDHEPTPRTRALEDEMLQGSHLALYDAHFKDVKDQMFGHGSQEHAARMAKAHPGTLVLAGHIGPMFSDEEVFATYGRHAQGVPNFRLALEGGRFRWNKSRGTFEKISGGEPL